jgi:hypothetical protein
MDKTGNHGFKLCKNLAHSMFDHYLFRVTRMLNHSVKFSTPGYTTATDKFQPESRRVRFESITNHTEL